jgi:phosphoserine phosphatase RsbU/P
VQAGLCATALIRALEQTIEEILRKQDRLEQELHSVAQYATSLLPVPGSFLPSVHMACAYQPALILGAISSMCCRGRQELSLYLLDASGHGVSPAL